MAYKIYTYADPYKLNKCEFWDEIKSLPHLCVAQTLANAIRDLYGKEMDTLICPIDNLLSTAYEKWHRNVHMQLKQYGLLTESLDAALASGQIDRSLHKSFSHGKKDVLQALRLFIELGIDGTKLKSDAANQEQVVLIDLLTRLSQGSAKGTFALQEVVDAKALQEAFDATACREKEIRLSAFSAWRTRTEEKGDTRKAEDIDKLYHEAAMLYDRVIRGLREKPISRIVIHGIHQFTPLQLRLIQRMDDIGVEVIFLFNYQSEYKEIYSTWHRVYRPFGVVPLPDRSVEKYVMRSDSRSHILARAIGSLYDPAQMADLRRSPEWKELLKSCQNQEHPLFIEFDNTTECANYVSNYFLEAQRQDEDNPLAVMREQVYSASRDVHEILKVYHPAYAGERHLLAYPIGQFFVALYRMWDSTAQQLKVDKKGLAECLSSGLLSTGPAEHLARIHHTASLYYEDVDTFSAFHGRMTEYIRQYTLVHGNTVGYPGRIDLRRLSVYDEELVTLADLNLLLAAVTELNSLATSLFVPAEGAADYVDLKQHFGRLEEFVRQGLSSLAQEEETRLIKELLDRLDATQYDEQTRSTISDLRDGIYFYLRQQERETEKWIVRNFEQIDGDILRSRSQHREAVSGSGEPDKVYHFAGLSDSVMNKTTDDLLPWPLTEKFIQEAYFPVDMAFQVYHLALGEYTSFLRYALFYGLCYNECDVRLSYVKNEARQVTQPYFILESLGLQARANSFEFSPNTPVALPGLPNVVAPVPFGVNQQSARAFYLCPYRYLLDYVLGRHSVISDKFTMSSFYVNLLVRAGWNSVAEKPYEQARKGLRTELERVNRTIANYFPYLRNINDSYDLITQAENYIVGQRKQGNSFKKYDETHMAVRLLYKKAVYLVEPDEWNHPNPYCAQLAELQKGKVRVSLYSVGQSVQEPLQKAMCSYLTSEDNQENPAEWCIYCPHKALCLKRYTRTDIE